MNANPLVSAAVPHHGLVLLADLDEKKVTPGLLGFAVFALIGGATWFLMKSMNKRLKKIDFEPAPEGAATGAASVQTAVPSGVDEPMSSGSAEGRP